MSLSLRVATPILLFLAAIVVRILPWHSVYQRDGVHPIGNDAYYHLRRIRYTIDHFPDVLDFDPLINFPEGARPIWSPPFDWLIAALLRPLPGIDQSDRFELLVVWIPPLVGAATVVLLYFMALRFYSRSAAILSAAALVILPGHVVYSMLGAIDHPVVVAALATVMLALSMQLFRCAASADGDRDGLWLSMGLGLSIASAVLVWPGCLLHVGVLQIAMIVRLVSSAETEAAIVWARRFFLVHLVAGVAVYPLCAGNEWSLWGSTSPVVLSDFQPLYFFSACVCFGLLGVIWRWGWLSSDRLRRGIASGVTGICVLAALVWLRPDLGRGVGDALSWFTKDEEFQSLVSESVPLFAHEAGLSHAIQLLSGFVFFVPPAIAALAWRFRRRADQLLLSWWAIAFFAATMVQWRFVNTYSVAHCLLIGISLTSAYEAWRRRSTKRLHVWGGAALGSMAVILAFAPSLEFYDSDLKNVRRAMRGQPTRPMGMRQASLVTAAARFLRDHSPPLGEVGYSVLGPWEDGHILEYVAQRPVVQDNFGDDVAPENFRRAREYFTSESELRALEIVQPMNTRYVLVRSTGAGQSREYSYDSVFTRLYLMRGSRGRPVRRDGVRLPLVESLRRHRLVYQSVPLRIRDKRPFCMLFEVVAGAELVGQSDPGAVVQASLLVKPRVGRRFEYVSQTRANEEGVYMLRLPYSNEKYSSEVQTGSSYRLRAGQRSQEIVIPESAVLTGARVDGPDLSRGRG